MVQKIEVDHIKPLTVHELPLDAQKRKKHALKAVNQGGEDFMQALLAKYFCFMNIRKHSRPDCICGRPRSVPKRN